MTVQIVKNVSRAARTLPPVEPSLVGKGPVDSPGAACAEVKGHKELRDPCPKWPYFLAEKPAVQRSEELE